jgi:hypothetical protein
MVFTFQSRRGVSQAKSYIRGKGATSATLLIASHLTRNTIRNKWPGIRYIVGAKVFKVQH